MPRKNPGPSWFKLWVHHRPLFEAVTDDVAGRVLKNALCYLAEDRIPPMGQLETVVFSAIQADIDEARSDYMLKVENGKRGGRPRKDEHEKPLVRSGYLPLLMVREGEREEEGEEEREGDGEVIPADMPPPRHSFFPPSVEEVKQYCREQGYSMNAEHFMDHYESNGWRVGKNKMKNWKAAVRNWNRKEQKNNGKTGSEQVWNGIGTVL